MLHVIAFMLRKIYTCGEGGALCTNDEDLAKRVNILKNHGVTKDAFSRHSEQYKHWDLKIVGWKYNISDILSALLIGQIDRLKDNLQNREAICSR